MTIAIVRIRGGIRTNNDIRDTLSMLRLDRQNHLVLVHSNPVSRGMLQKVKDYVTWGEPDLETITNVIQFRGRLVGDRPITDDYIKTNSGFASTRDFAAAVLGQKAKYSDLKDIKPVIRLHPPRGGYENTKISYKAGGSLGHRGKDINTLIMKMLGPGSGHWAPRKPPGRKGQTEGGKPHA
jgi:large subunit ribosomal protein L30